MLRRNFSKKIKIDNILKYLELVTKSVAIMIIIATVIGGLNIYFYLIDINHLFLFSDVVGISYASISALVSYYLFTFLVSVGFLSPFIIRVFLFLISNDDNENKENKITSNNSKMVFNPSPRLVEPVEKIKSCLSKLVFNPSPRLVEPVEKIKSCLIFILLYISPLLLIIVPLLPIFCLLTAVCFISNFVARELFFGKERNLSSAILSKFIHWISFLCTLSIALVIFFGNKFSEHLLYGVFLFFVSISFLYIILFTKNIHNKKKLDLEKLSSIIVLSLISILPPLLHFLFVVYPTVSIVKYDIAFILFYIFSVLLFGLSCFLSHIAIYDCFYGKEFCRDKKYDIRLIFVNFIFIFSYALYVSFFLDYNMSLYALRFIEKPQNSSWYIIHNGNTTSETINGMTKGEIKYRQQFFIPNGWQQYCKDDIFDSVNMQNCTTLRNENALYGYMAWNLGNTKVFCPQSVDFFKTDSQDERNAMSQKCLVIDGKYLQPVSEYYLKQPME